MAKPIIKVENLSKSFTVFHRTSGLKGMLLHLPKYFKDQIRPYRREVLKQVSLEVAQGEAVGIAGPNGCGKTTLLSIIGKVISPDCGRVTVNGRVSMMLALGAGFASDLSGRENIMLNGVLQGMTRRRMRELMDEIIDFTGIGDDFIDSPIYQYSSGMKARLGFAVAIITQPDILLVDEVLAVGDSNFQEKCINMLKEKRDNGMTVLLVSHSPSQVQSFCDRLLYMQDGEILLNGKPEEITPTIKENNWAF